MSQSMYDEMDYGPLTTNSISSVTLGNHLPGGTQISQGVITNSVLNSPTNRNYLGDETTTAYQPIKGKMLLAEYVLSENEIEHMKDSFGKDGYKYKIKEMLAQMMVEKMLQEDCFDFGMQQNYTDFTYTFRGRIFVTPNNQTQMIKKYLEQNK